MRYLFAFLACILTLVALTLAKLVVAGMLSGNSATGTILGGSGVNLVFGAIYGVILVLALAKTWRFVMGKFPVKQPVSPLTQSTFVKLSRTIGRAVNNQFSSINRQRSAEEDLSQYDDKFFEIALKEIQSNTINSVAWAKALVLSEGNAEKCKSIYIKMRVAYFQELQKKRTKNTNIKQSYEVLIDPDKSIVHDRLIDEQEEKVKQQNGTEVLRVIGGATEQLRDQTHEYTKAQKPPPPRNSIPEQSQINSKKTLSNSNFSVIVISILITIAIGGVFGKLAMQSAAFTPSSNNNDLNIYYTPPNPINIKRTIQIYNQCIESISVSIIYWNGDDWVTKGWWIVEPLSHVNTGLQTISKDIYAYAFSTNYTWQANAGGGLARLITKESYTYSSISPMTAYDTKMVPFLRVSTSEGVNSLGSYYEFSLSCPSESDAHFAAIKAVHPDLDKIDMDPKFNDWIASKPQKLRLRNEKIRIKGTPDEVINMLNHYKSDIASLPKTSRSHPIPSNADAYLPPSIRGDTNNDGILSGSEQYLRDYSQR